LFLAVCGVALEAGAQPAVHSYPTRPIRVVVPYPPGGGNDNMGRLIAQRLTESFMQPAVVDNRGGAGGRVGAEYVAKAAAPDGYTLLMAGSTLMITAPALYQNLQYDVQRDFAAITRVGFTAYVLVVHPGVPARTVSQFIALARSRPGALNYSSSGSGGAGPSRRRAAAIPYRDQDGARAVQRRLAGNDAASWR